MAAAATPRIASRLEYDCPSPIRFLFGPTTYYSRLTCPVAGTRMKFLVSRSPLGSHAKARLSARDSRAAPCLAKFRIQKCLKLVRRASQDFRIGNHRCERLQEKAKFDRPVEPGNQHLQMSDAKFLRCHRTRQNAASLRPTVTLPSTILAGLP